VEKTVEEQEVSQGLDEMLEFRSRFESAGELAEEKL
jgi:hypothetical protein